MKMKIWNDDISFQQRRKTGLFVFDGYPFDICNRISSENNTFSNTSGELVLSSGR